MVIITGMLAGALQELLDCPVILAVGIGAKRIVIDLAVILCRYISISIGIVRYTVLLCIAQKFARSFHVSGNASSVTETLPDL